MDVKLEDGTVLKNVPEGTTKSQLRDRVEKSGRFAADQLSAMFGQAEEPGFNLEFDEEQPGQREEVRNPPIDTLDTIGRKTLEQFTSNITGLPDLIATAAPHLMATLLPRENDPSLIQSPMEVISNLVKGLSGGAVDPAGEGDVFRKNLPKLGQRIIPGIPSGQQAVAGGEAAVDAAGNLLSGQTPNLSGEFEANLNRSQQMTEENPIATTVGKLGGDVLSILTGGRPMTSAARRLDTKRAFLPPSQRDPGTLRFLDDVFRSSFGRKAEQFGRRAGEAGLEGFGLAVLDEGDPLKTAVLSSAAQAGGSTILGINRALLGKGLTPTMGRTAATFFGLTVAIDLLKEKIPGVDSNFSDSLKTSTTTLASLLGAGLLSSAAGFGRIGGRRREDMKTLMDAITAIPRGSIESVIKDFSKVTVNEGFEEMVKALNQDPLTFGPNVKKRVERAFRSGNLKSEFDKLLKNKKFRDTLNEIRGQNE